MTPGYLSVALAPFAACIGFVIWVNKPISESTNILSVSDSIYLHSQVSEQLYVL